MSVATACEGPSSPAEAIGSASARTGRSRSRRTTLCGPTTGAASKWTLSGCDASAPGAYGLGENVVQGAVDPDEYYFRSFIRLTTAAPSLGHFDNLLGIATGQRDRDVVHIHVHEVV